MLKEIRVISLLLPLNLGRVNCYLIDTDAGYILIDTGGSNQRSNLETALRENGCQSGNLNLILITHGDFDHTGNASYLRNKYATNIAMHYDDLGMAENGDLFCGDLFDNTEKPALSSLMSDLGAARESVEKLEGLGINAVYPGHGKPFSLNSVINGL